MASVPIDWSKQETWEIVIAFLLFVTFVGMVEAWWKHRKIRLVATSMFFTRWYRHGIRLGRPWEKDVADTCECEGNDYPVTMVLARKWYTVVAREDIVPFWHEARLAVESHD